MEIHAQSPLHALSNILIPIDPLEADLSEITVLQSFMQKMADYGWYKGTLGQYYYLKNSNDERGFLIYFIPKVCRFELGDNGHNLLFTSNTFRLSIPRSFFKLNLVYEKLSTFSSFNYDQQYQDIYSYDELLANVKDLQKPVIRTEATIHYPLINRTEFMVNHHDDQNQIIIKSDNLIWSIQHNIRWCFHENYWKWLQDIMVHGFQL